LAAILFCGEEIMSEAVQGFMTEKEFLAQIKVCRATLHKFKTEKLITYYKAGRRVLYDEQSLLDFKEKCARRIESKSK
jgi:hypothetical protein